VLFRSGFPIFRFEKLAVGVDAFWALSKCPASISVPELTLECLVEDVPLLPPDRILWNESLGIISLFRRLGSLFGVVTIRF
jgi:hypothetical protein